MRSSFSINLAWTSKRSNIVEQYRKWIQICNANNIKCVRLFLAPWCIDPIHNPDDMEILCEILAFAEGSFVKVILVLDTYVNYSRFNYRDFKNNDYGWTNYRFSHGQPLTDFLCDTGKTSYVLCVLQILQKIRKYQNVSIIELCNEIDQIDANKKVVIHWINNTFLELTKQFGARYEYRVSISDYRKYHAFAQRVMCKCDIHSYRFPFNTALENYQYFAKSLPDTWISEFAYYSDFSYSDSIESKIYFAALTIVSYLDSNGEDSLLPAPWWWEDILTDPSYMGILPFLLELEVLHSATEAIPFKIFKKPSISIGHKKQKDKILYRLSVLCKNPRFLRQEIPAITKYLHKQIWPKYNHSCSWTAYKNEHHEMFVLLETYVPIQLQYAGNVKKEVTINCFDLIRQRHLALNEVIALQEGLYWIHITG